MALMGVRSQEWVAAFYIVVGVALIATLGIHPVTALVILSIIGLTLIASRTCIASNYTYWKSLSLVASINPSGETFIGQVFVLPALAVASVYSWALGIVGILGAKTWSQRRWVAFLRAYRKLVLRVSIKD
jgi:hypothetical protein